jgi:hypothetical protein
MMSVDKLDVAVTFDPERGYIACAPDLRQPVTALSLGGVRRRVEALMLVWTGLIRNLLSLRPGRDVAGAAGLCVFVFALFAWPLVGRLLGRPWLQAEIFGIAPDPTVVATLGALIAADRTRWELLVVPMLWCAISGATLWAMQSPDAWLAPAAALLALVLACWKTLSPLRQASPARWSWPLPSRGRSRFRR